MEAHTATVEEALALIEATETLLDSDRPDGWRDTFKELQEFFNGVGKEGNTAAWIDANWQVCHRALKALKTLKARVSGGLDEAMEVYTYYFDVVVDVLLDGHPGEDELLRLGVLCGMSGRHGGGPEVCDDLCLRRYPSTPRYHPAVRDNPAASDVGARHPSTAPARATDRHFRG